MEVEEDNNNCGTLLFEHGTAAIAAIRANKGWDGWEMFVGDAFSELILHESGAPERGMRRT